MMPLFKKTTLLLCITILVSALTGCFGSKAEETTPPTLEPIVLPTAPAETEATVSPERLEEHLSLVLEAGELYTLDYYPNLKTVDLSGSTCYSAIVDFASKRPHLDITYSVSVGATDISSKAPSAALKCGAFDYDLLMENLKYLPDLTGLTLVDMDLTTDQLSALREAYPDLVLDYTVELFGTGYSVDTTDLDLSAMNSAGVDEACEKLGKISGLTDVTLNNSLSFEDVDKLQSAVPHIRFHYTFQLLGRTVSTGDDEIIYKNQNFGDSEEAEIRKALKILDHTSRFVLDNCGFSNETLAKLREDFRGGPKVIWRVYFGTQSRYNTLTDDDTIRAVYNVTDDTCGPMKYLEDVKYMDLGHNEYLTDFSFVGYMPELEVLIGSGSAVKDLSGIENCKKLTWLELASCLKLDNIEPLAGCEGLKYLNISYTKVKDLSPLDALKLERFVDLNPKASTKEQNTFLTIHPKAECITVFYGYSQPYGYGWRYDDNGKTMFWYYKDVIREVFEYDKADKILKAQENAKK